MAECTGLENRRTARYRGFESPPLRFDSKAVSESQQDAISCSGNGLRLVVSGEPEDGEDAPGFNRSQPEAAVRAKKCDRNEPIELGQSRPTVETVRQSIQDCAELPEPVRAAMLALMSTL